MRREGAHEVLGEDDELCALGGCLLGKVVRALEIELRWPVRVLAVCVGLGARGRVEWGRRRQRRKLNERDTRHGRRSGGQTAGQSKRVRASLAVVRGGRGRSCSRRSCRQHMVPSAARSRCEPREPPTASSSSQSSQTSLAAYSAENISEWPMGYSKHPR